MSEQDHESATTDPQNPTAADKAEEAEEGTGVEGADDLSDEERLASIRAKLAAAKPPSLRLYDRCFRPPSDSGPLRKKGL